MAVERAYRSHLMHDTPGGTLRDDSRRPVPLTSAEAASLLGISTRSLQANRRKWGLAAAKLGRDLIFQESDVLDLLRRAATEDAKT